MVRRNYWDCVENGLWGIGLVRGAVAAGDGGGGR